MTTKTRGLTLAKASEDDINSTLNFLKALKALTEEPFKLQDWEHDEQLYPILKSFCYHVPEWDEESKGHNEKYLTLENVIHEFNTNVSHKFWRVIIGADTLIRNVCDPNESHLAYHSKFMEPTELLCEIDDYLSENPKNYIGNGSKLHEKIKKLISDGE